jgi:hypothetical protein
MDDFLAFSDTFADLRDPEVIKGAWGIAQRKDESST